MLPKRAQAKVVDSRSLSNLFNLALGRSVAPMKLPLLTGIGGAMPSCFGASRSSRRVYARRLSGG